MRGFGHGFAGDGGYALADAVFHSYRHYDAEYLFEIALYHWLFYPRGTAKTRPARADSDSPTAFASISVLVPLFRETNIAERLIARMKNLKYPRELLEICLVVEENDTETRAVIDATPTALGCRLLSFPTMICARNRGR